MPSAGDGAPHDSSKDNSQDHSQENLNDGSEQKPEDGSASAGPTDDELLQHLGAAVRRCWNDLSFPDQVKILAQTNDVIGKRPIAEARNEIVKLLLRHTKMWCSGVGTTARMRKPVFSRN
jgi:hypothetical protein